MLGALIAGQFSSTIDSNLSGEQLSPQAQHAVDKAKDKPLATADTADLAAVEATTVDNAVTDASAKSFHLGVAAGGLLMIVGRHHRGDRPPQPESGDGVRGAGSRDRRRVRPCPRPPRWSRRGRARATNGWRSPHRLQPCRILRPDARVLLESSRLAHMVTLNPDGSPQVSCVWVGLDGDEIVSGHLPRNQKVKNVERDSRVAISIEGAGLTEHGLREYLVVRGLGRVQEGGAPELLQRARSRLSRDRTSSSRPWTTRRPAT